MPHTQQHEQNKVKNYLLLIVLLVFVGIFFSVTIIKMSNASKHRASENQTKTEQADKPSEEQQSPAN